MAKSPQLENGYTRIANEILEALLSAGLTARQWAVVMAVIRKTYGFNKKSDDIGLSQLREMTGIDKAHLSRAVRDLESMKILTRSVGVHGHHLGLNKDLSNWGLPKEQPLPDEQLVLKEQPGVAESATLGVAESANEGLPKEQPQKKGFKDNEKTTSKDMSAEALARFEKFYGCYPKKRNRQDAVKAFAKLNPDDDLLQTMIEAVATAAATRSDWIKDDGQFVPYAASWINAEGWMDEAQKVAYAEHETAVIALYNDIMGAEWPRAVADPYSPARASAIREFLGFRDIPDMARKYFEHCAANLEAFEACGFDWIIRRDTYLRVREGAHRQKVAA